jgi:hypothetical protein
MPIKSFTPSQNNPVFASPIYELVTVSTIADAGAHTYTVAELMGGLINRDCNGASRSDVTPTAAALVAALPDGRTVGRSFRLHVRNTSSGAYTITLTAGTGITLSGTMTIAQNNGKDFRVYVTNGASGSEAVTIYSLGTVVF